MEILDDLSSIDNKRPNKWTYLLFFVSLWLPFTLVFGLDEFEIMHFVPLLERTNGIILLLAVWARITYLYAQVMDTKFWSIFGAILVFVVSFLALGFIDELFHLRFGGRMMFILVALISATTFSLVTFVGLGIYNFWAKRSN